MNLNELIKKIDNLNKMNKELDFDTKYYLVVSDRWGTPTYIYNKKDLKKVNEKYIDEVANVIINDVLVKEERYFYSIIINDEKYDIRIGVE